MTTVLALILWSRPAAAQEPIPVTLAQAESAAIGSTAPVIAQAEAAARSAHAGVGAAWAIEDPVVSVGATRYSAQRTYGVGVLLPVFGQSIPAIHAARQDADAADLEVDLARLEARSEVDGAWFWLWAAQQSADVFRSSQDDAVRLRDAVKARFDAGDVPKSDLLAAESRLARATAEASGAQATERSASAQLAALVGMDPAQVLVADPAGVDPLGGELPPLDGLIASLSNHPELAAAVHRQEAARARTRAARADWLPLLGIDLGMDQGDPGLPGTDLSATASIAVPIGGRHGAEVAAARADADADAAALEQTRARATADP
ncbi:MAG: TolC family protein, partial [Myxococcota bacterium]